MEPEGTARTETAFFSHKNKLQNLKQFQNYVITISRVTVMRMDYANKQNFVVEP